MKLKSASLDAIKYSCLNYHYSKKVPTNPFGFSVFNKKNEFCGCIVYGSGANNNIAKYLNVYHGEYLELTRMALNGKQEKTSKALSLSIRLIKKYKKNIRVIVSYADLDQNHKGTIYKATNWVFDGYSMLNKPDGSFIIDGKRIHGRTLSAKLKKRGLSVNKENLIKYFKTNDVKKYITKGRIRFLYYL